MYCNCNIDGTSSDVHGNVMEYNVDGNVMEYRISAIKIIVMKRRSKPE